MNQTTTPTSLVNLKAATDPPAALLRWVDGQAERMLDRVVNLAEINSGTSNREGVERVAALIEPMLADSADTVERKPLTERIEIGADGQPITIPSADAMVARRRSGADRCVLLNIHLDTVFGIDDPFQSVVRRSDRLVGPGVADAKGGLVVMLAALEAFERNGPDPGVGWTVVLNPDEEIGSPASVGLLQELAEEADLGLVYEPALPDGTLIRQRKGSGNFTVVVRGRSAHAGREIERGRNAVAALARLLVEIEGLHDPGRGVSLNLGRVVGGGPSNIVPDLAVGRFNARAEDDAGVEWVETRLGELVEDANQADGIVVELHGRFTSPPKPFDTPTQQLFARVQSVGQTLGLSLPTAASGGVCDGNKLAATGLPTIDTLGPCGGHLHSDREFVLIDSLVERARLSAALLDDFARHPEHYPARTRRGA